MGSFRSEGPSRSPSVTPTPQPSSPQSAAGRSLNAGFYELHEGGRRAHGSYAHKDRQVQALGTQVWQCLVQARSESPQEERNVGCDLSAEYGFKRLGKPTMHGRGHSSIVLQWPEWKMGTSEPLRSGKSHVGHLGQDSHQTLACLQMPKRLGCRSPRSGATESLIPDTEEANSKEQADVLCQEEVRAGMMRRAGRGLRATSPGNAFRSLETSPRDGFVYDDLRIEKHLPCRGGKKDWNRNSSRMAEMVSPRQEHRTGCRPVTSHKPSELWAPWLLTYEKELREQSARLRNGVQGPGISAPPVPLPLPFGLAAGSGPRIFERGRGRSRSPDRSSLRGMAGKPSLEAPPPGRPFWLGDTDSATPLSTSHSYYGRSQSPKRLRMPSPQAEAKQGYPRPEVIKSEGKPKEALRSESPDVPEEVAVPSPSRFSRDNPTSLREQLAEESFLVPTALAAGKPIVFGFLDESGRRPSKRSTLRSVSPSTVR